jgi:two-component system, chemotaxis family, response regulator PixH
MTTVLIVEDTQTEAIIISGTLQDAGFQTLRASSSEEARTQLGQQKPDLILLDVVLPGESGFELCRDLKDKADTKGIPIVLCSTKSTEMDKFWGMKQGASSYLTKPLLADELVRTVRLLTQG